MNILKFIQFLPYFWTFKMPLILGAFTDNPTLSFHLHLGQNYLVYLLQFLHVHFYIWQNNPYAQNFLPKIFLMIFFLFTPQKNFWIDLNSSKNNLIRLFSIFVKILYEINSGNSKAVIIIDMNLANVYKKVKVVDLSR